MATPKPPDRHKAVPTRLDDHEVVQYFQRAGTRPQDEDCPRCLTKADINHRRNGTIACEVNCLLCDKPGHKGKPCPLLMQILGKDWLNEHWPGHENVLTDDDIARARQALRDAQRSFEPSQHRYGRYDRGGHGGRGGFGSQWGRDRDGEPSRKRRRDEEDDTTKPRPTPLAEQSDFDIQSDPRLSYMQSLARRRRSVLAPKDDIVMGGDLNTPARVNELELERQVLRRQVDRLKGQITQMTEDAMDQAKHVDMLECRNETLNVSYEALTKKFESLETEHAALQRKATECSKMAADTISLLHSDSQIALANYGKREVQLLKLQKENQELKRQLQGLQDHASGTSSRPQELEAMATSEDVVGKPAASTHEADLLEDGFGYNSPRLESDGDIKPPVGIDLDVDDHDELTATDEAVLKVEEDQVG